MNSDGYSRRRPRPSKVCGIDPRSARSVTVLLVLFTLCSAFVLTSRFQLANETHYPVHSIGWQAGAKAFHAKAKAAAAGQAVLDAGGLDEGNRTVPSLPPGFGDAFAWKPSDWNPSDLDSRPITEITLVSCVLPPSLVVCFPKATPKEILERGEWIRVERDLNARAGIYYLFLFVRRLPPGSSAAVVTNLTLLTHSPTITDLPGKGTWVEVSSSIRSGLEFPRLDAMFLHYRLNTQEQVRAERRITPGGGAGDLEPITELDVIFGDTQANPLWGFERVPGMISGGTDDSSSSREGCALAVRKALTPLPVTPTLQFSPAGNFTILQVADLHFSTGKGECRDLEPASQQKKDCEAMGADLYALKWMELAIAETKPDLLVFTGDQLNGQDTSWSSQTALMKFAPTLFKLGIPWTVIFGNHDDEVGQSREEQMQLMSTMPYFIGEAGPTGADMGVGNYLRSVSAGDARNTTLLNLYFVDSHAYAPKSTLGFFSNPGYDFIKPSQINWFKSTSSKVTPHLRPYLPSAATLSKAKAATKVKPTASVKSTPTISPPAMVNAITAAAAVEEAFETEQALKLEEEAEELADDLKRRSAAQVDLEDPDGFDMGMMPSDGSKIVNENAKDSPASSDDFALLLDGPPPKPFHLEKGPTKANPMLAKPNAITFFHIPLTEAYSLPIDVGKDGKRLVVGQRLEGSGASKTNSGFFEQAILGQGEVVASTVDMSDSGAIKDEFWDGESEKTTGRSETKILVNGHNHISDDCRRLQGVWSCFGGGGSYAGYGKAGFPRRMRVLQVSDWGETIESFKLLDTTERIDHLVLVGEEASI